MRRSALCLAAWLLGHTAPAQLVINLPFDGLAQGREVAAPLVLPATTNLAGWQCDVSYNATRLVCTSVTSTQAVPGVLVVDGALYPTNTGSFRVLGCHGPWLHVINARSGAVWIDGRQSS